MHRLSLILAAAFCFPLAACDEEPECLLPQPASPCMEVAAWELRGRDSLGAILAFGLDYDSVENLRPERDKPWPVESMLECAAIVSEDPGSCAIEYDPKRHADRYAACAEATFPGSLGSFCNDIVNGR